MDTDVDICYCGCVGIEGEKKQSFGGIEAQLIILICTHRLRGVIILGDVDGGDGGIILLVGECDKEDDEERCIWVGYTSYHVI